jgi:hypothetical protein
MQSDFVSPGRESTMKTVKRIMLVVLVYVGIVIAFESLLGYFQPATDTTLVITTTTRGGTPNDRVLARLESGDQLYVAANHWPRAWYTRALENPNVQITLDGEPGDYLAVPVTGEEHDRVDAEHGLGVMFRVLTGFPPRYFVRLDPR